MRDTLRNAIEQPALRSSSKAQQPQPVLEGFEVFQPGLGLCQSHTQLVTGSYTEKYKEKPGWSSPEQRTYFKTCIGGMSGKCQSRLPQGILQKTGRFKLQTPQKTFSRAFWRAKITVNLRSLRLAGFCGCFGLFSLLCSKSTLKTSVTRRSGLWAGPKTFWGQGKLL